MEGLLTGGLMDVARSGGGADDGDGHRSHRRDGGEEAGDGSEREERSRSSSVEVVASAENDADRDRQADGDRRRQGYSPPQSHQYQYPQQQGHKQGPGTWGWPGGPFSEWNSCCLHMPPGKVAVTWWGRYKRPPNLQVYAPPVDDSVDTEPTQDELHDLSKACSRLWELDLNRLVPGKDFKLDCEVGKKVYREEDRKRPSLFRSLAATVFMRPTYRRFSCLLDNYYPSQRRREVVTPEKYEQAAFIEEISRTAPIKYLYKCLVSKGIISGDYEEFKRVLTGLWFDLYGRGDVSGSSSAFEHVFVGEIKEQGAGEVSGFHNWIQFYSEEARGRVDYHGYIFPNRCGQDPDSETQLLTVQFNWNDVLKAVLVGVSPEFEVALYTLCFFLGGEDNHICLGPYSVNIKCYRHDNDKIGSIFPIYLD